MHAVTSAKSASLAFGIGTRDGKGRGDCVASAPAVFRPPPVRQVHAVRKRAARGLGRPEAVTRAGAGWGARAARARGTRAPSGVRFAPRARYGQEPGRCVLGRARCPSVRSR
ncbi:hypothetical protein GCM10028832_09850 [Streptomyces sparsus]